jgi:hypothetical protein
MEIAMKVWYFGFLRALAVAHHVQLANDQRRPKTVTEYSISK